MNLTVVSFYTPDWKYSEYANKLRVNCELFKLPHYIVERPSTGDYVKNCNIKPSFILHALTKLKSPVLWIDADGELLRTPELLLNDELSKYDIAGIRTATNYDRIHVGSIWFNYNDKTIDFVEQWKDSLVEKGIDDGAFNTIWQNNNNKINFFELPLEYHYIHKYHYSTIPDSTVILHRLSSSDLKLKYKNKVEHR
jgi:hypothetical protein